VLQFHHGAAEHVFETTGGSKGRALAAHAECSGGGGSIIINQTNTGAHFLLFQTVSRRNWATGYVLLLFQYLRCGSIKIFIKKAQNLTTLLMDQQRNICPSDRPIWSIRFPHLMMHRTACIGANGFTGSNRRKWLFRCWPRRGPWCSICFGWLCRLRSCDIMASSFGSNFDWGAQLYAVTCIILCTTMWLLQTTVNEGWLCCYHSHVKSLPSPEPRSTHVLRTSMFTPVRIGSQCELGKKYLWFALRNYHSQTRKEVSIKSCL